MEITLNELSQLHIKGNIKSPEHFHKIKEKTHELLQQGDKMIHILIEDSFSITSAVIHHLFHLIHHETVSVKIEANDPRLYRTLESLELIEHFNVKLAARERI